jgi:hypothetical protein
VQVTDTPGVLYRPDEERNAMELLTVATLEHLPTAAVFVMDFTEQCGCSCQQQWQIRTELLTRFPHKLWIDVITKMDLLEEEIDVSGETAAQPPPNENVVPKDAAQAVRVPFCAAQMHVLTDGMPSISYVTVSLAGADSVAATCCESVLSHGERPGQLEASCVGSDVR